MGGIRETRHERSVGIGETRQEQGCGGGGAVLCVCERREREVLSWSKNSHGRPTCQISLLACHFFSLTQYHDEEKSSLEDKDGYSLLSLHCVISTFYIISSYILIMMFCSSLSYFFFIRLFLSISSSFERSFLAHISSLIHLINITYQTFFHCIISPAP